MSAPALVTIERVDGPRVVFPWHAIVWDGRLVRLGEGFGRSAQEALQRAQRDAG